ncbi:MAG: hypothetical protein ACNA8W_24370 [Bradymonadaceae bacterium]
MKTLQYAALTTIFLTSLLLTSSPSMGWACIYDGPGPFQFAGPDEEPPSDVEPPADPRAEVRRIQRGKFGGGSTCDDQGSIWLHISNHDEALGYRYEAISGDLPNGLSLPTNVLQGETVLHWVDGRTDFQEPFGFDLAITAVDRWGRESEPFILYVFDEGTGQGCGGCALATTNKGVPLSPFIPALLLLAAYIHTTRRPI